MMKEKLWKSSGFGGINFMLAVSFFCYLLSLFLLKTASRVNSDSMYLDALVGDVLFGNGLWQDWRLTVAPTFFPDMFFSILSFTLFNDPSTKIYFVTVLQSFVLMSAFYIALNGFFGVEKKESILFSLILSSYLNVTAGHSNICFFLNTTNCHFSVMVVSVWVMHFVKKEHREPKVSNLIAIFLLSFVGEISTAVQFLNFNAPVIVLSVFFIAKEWINRKSVSWGIPTKMFLVMGGTHVLVGKFQEVFLSNNVLLQERLKIDISRIHFSIEAFKSAVSLSFEIDNRITLFLSVFVSCAVFFSLVFLTLKWKNRKNQILDAERMEIFVVFFALFSLVVSFVGTIVSGGFIDKWGFRYFGFPFLLLASWLVYRCCKIRPSGLVKLASTLCLSVLIAWALQFDRSHALGFFDNEGLNFETRPAETPLAKCLNAFEEAHPGLLKAGVADYWASRGITYMTKARYPMLQLLQNFDFFYWMTTKGPLLRPERYPEYDFNFAIMGKKVPGQFHFSTDTVGPLLPKPAGNFECVGGEYEIWHYNGLEFNAFVRSRVNKNFQ